MAKWERGKMIEGQYFFHDDLKYDFDKWDYCTTTDRRFYAEIKKGRAGWLTSPRNASGWPNA